MISWTDLFIKMVQCSMQDYYSVIHSMVQLNISYIFIGGFPFESQFVSAFMQIWLVAISIV